jgi:crossover junction endodeoxyribonuclease RuvC
MLQHILNTKDLPKQLDATDGLAAAVCHHFKVRHGNESVGGSKKASWTNFVKNNPGKISK